MTKFPPPPYLPGEVERREELKQQDSDNERQKEHEKMQKSLYHYF
jgi:hypothetical protein